jgi:predicted RNA-binding Zn-ribbon protein involved in translation (DUF1610 family)
MQTTIHLTCENCNFGKKASPDNDLETYCPDCGNALIWICPHCDRPLANEKSKFCSFCGEPLQKEKDS